MTSWNYKEYETWLERGCKKNESVTRLELRNKQLTSIPPEIGQLENLTALCLERNRIASIPPEIGQLRNLTHLHIGDNALTSIPPEIGQLTKLTELWLGNNQLTFIPPEIGQLTNLTFLSLSTNKLTSIPQDIGRLTNLNLLSLSTNQLTSIPPEIGQLMNLTRLYIGDNQLMSIPPEIGQLMNLTHFWLYNNQLTSIPPEIGGLTNLTYLSLYHNQLTSIPPEIGQLRNLQIFYIDNNPIEHIPANVARLLNRQRTTQGIYRDTQSVHNSHIQKTIKESIFRLLKEENPKEKEVIPLILSDSNLDQFAKESLVEYCRDESVHSELNVTFEELLILVWNRIIISSHSSEIKAVLNTEMRDAECKCFTGRISRLVNCLSGFDPLVNIQISDNEQIGNVISVIKIQLEEKKEYTVERHKEEANSRLRELGVKEEEIQIWLSYIE